MAVEYEPELRLKEMVVKSSVCIDFGLLALMNPKRKRYSACVC